MDLQDLLIDIFLRVRLKKMPELVVSGGTFAYSRMNKIHIGRRVLLPLKKLQKEAMIAHEVYHATNFGKALASNIIVPVAFVAIMSVLYLASAYESSFLLSFAPPSAFLPILFISTLFISVIWGTHSCRRSEVEADRFAASMVGPRSFVSALGKLKPMQFKHGLLSRLKELLCPHPPLNKRLESVRNVKRLPRLA